MFQLYSNDSKQKFNFKCKLLKINHEKFEPIGENVIA